MQGRLPQNRMFLETFWVSPAPDDVMIKSKAVGFLCASAKKCLE